MGGQLFPSKYLKASFLEFSQSVLCISSSSLSEPPIIVDPGSVFATRLSKADAIGLGLYEMEGLLPKMGSSEAF